MKNKNFFDLGLSNKVLKSIETLGFIQPSKIQEEVIPLIINNYDVIGQAQTGTGKTLAFAASVLSKIDVRDNVVKAIVLTPTRELALQVSEEFETLNKSSKFDVLPVFGGTNIELQIRALRRGVDVVVGTPGRVMDLIKRQVLKMNHLEFFVLDEADEMLNMGFLDDIKFIFNKTNKEKQVLLFSATMPKEILDLASEYMKPDYQYVSIKELTKTSANVSQFYYVVNEKIKIEAMCRVIDSKNPKLGIIFCQTKRDVDRLLTELQGRDYSVEAMHGDIAQSMRIKTLERFKNGSFQFLIATDVAARGIHVDNVDLVINYSLPQYVEAYVHRIGRTGRAASKGEAISFVTPREIKFLQDIMRSTKSEIIKQELPNAIEIYDAKYNKLVSSVESLIEEKKHEEYIKYVRDMNKGDLIKFASGLLKYSMEKEIGSDFKQNLVVKERKNKTRKSGTTRVFLTIGKIDKLKKGTLLDFLKEKTGINKDTFQNIDILNKFTFMDVTSKNLDAVMKKVHNQKLNNRVIRVEIAKNN